MKPPIRILLVITSLAASFQVANMLAEAIDYSEVSLLVRAHESEPAIVQEVSQRKLVHTLTPQQENTLRTQGASDSLIQTLRRSDLVLPAAAATAFESRREQLRQVRPALRPVANGNEPMVENPSEDVHIFNVAFGHPINLSRWGGFDYEIAFYSYRNAGEDFIEPVMIDPIRTVTEVSRPIRFTSEDEAFNRDWFPTNEVRNRRFTPYDARGELRDNRLNLNDTVSVRSNAASRPLSIDWQNPTFISGQPYAFYPVYGTGDVSLYYITKANDRTARIAIVSRH